ncbi:MAG: hypothetical protein ACK4M2_01690 [Brevundimonas sp.]
MGFGKHLQDLVAEVDAHLGDRARWSGVDGEVVIHPFDADETARMGGTELFIMGRMIQVHRRWVADPGTNDMVELLDEDGALVETLRVSSPPEIDVDGFWRCVVTAA